MHTVFASSTIGNILQALILLDIERSGSTATCAGILSALRNFAPGEVEALLADAQGLPNRGIFCCLLARNLSLGSAYIEPRQHVRSFTQPE